MSLEEQWSAGHKVHHLDRENRIENAYKCLRLVKQLFAFERVADFGCGIGAWLAAAELLGAKEIKGFEGPWVMQSDTLIAKEFIQAVDFRNEQLSLSKRYDLAMSIEVAEHLPETAANSFVETLVSASDRILFSAAIPNQGGIGHINEQPLSYWLSKFWSRGYVPLEAIRPYIARDLSIYPWLRQNLVMFVSYDCFLNSPSLSRVARPLSDFQLRYYY